MKMEENFKDTLERAVSNEPPVIDSWATFERRVRRDRAVRMFASMAAIVAVIVAAVIVVPKLGRSPSIITPSTNPPSPSPSPSVDEYAGWDTFKSPATDRYTLRHPTDWRVVKYEGSHEVLAPGQIGTQEGSPTMAVTLELLEGEFDSPELRSQGFDRSTRADGRPYVWTEETLSNGAKHQYRFDWSTCVRGIMEPGCIRTPQTLYITIQAGTAQLVESYLATAEKIVTSIAYVGPVGPYVISDSAAPNPQSS